MLQSQIRKILLLCVLFFCACNSRTIGPRVIGPPPGALGPAPQVNSITPASWGVKGGTTVTIDGELFDPASTVTLGGTPCLNVTVVSDTRITCDIQYHPAAAVDVVVSNPDGQTGVLLGGFKYNSFLYVSTQSGAAIYGYIIDSATAAVSSIGSVTSPAGAYQMVVDPTNTRLYVATGTTNQIAGYTINSGTGVLTPITGSPFSAGSGADGIAITPDGKKLFSSNFTGNSITTYTVNTTTGALTQVGTYAAGNKTGAMTIDKKGNFLYATNYGSNTLSAFQINSDASLTQLAGSPYSQAGCTGDDGVAFHPNFTWIYAGCAGSTSAVVGWTASSSTGLLTNLGVWNAVDNATGGNGVAIDSTGSYLYSTAFQSGTVRGFSIGTNGALTPLTPTNQYTAQVGTNYVVIQTLGKIVVTANTTSNSFTVFSRSTQNGQLTFLQNYPIGTQPGTVILTN